MPCTDTISSPSSGIDFRPIGVVIAGVTVAATIVYICMLCYGCHVCRAISFHVVAGQLLHPLLMELLTGNKLKWSSALWKCIIDWAVKVKCISVCSPCEVKGPHVPSGPCLSPMQNISFTIKIIMVEDLRPFWLHQMLHV